MSDEYQLDTKEYDSLKTASSKIFDVIAKRLNVQTAYITKKGENEMTVLSSLNKYEEIVPEDFTIDYKESHCRLIINKEDNTLNTNNLMSDELTREMKASAQLQVKGYLGVTLKDLNGEVFGTLCVMDRDEKEFDEEDVEFLHSIAAILSHMIELDQTNYNIGFMNVPIIPTTQGVAVTPVQGIIDEKRADKLLNDVLHHGMAQEIDHFIIDLSGLVIHGQEFPRVIEQLVNSLQVMGIHPILTGITPDIAYREMDSMNLSGFQLKTVPNLEAALSYIGFQLKEEQNSP
ncbi:rsbT co-antagonist protein RsbR [Halobacillus dabanensis]|uniref:RsbT co-antagonist protein RsbR n=1 Tax=Halobacillus dabanensis TaxID=240302 RepID=A0A1I3RKF6_HALDA|nr:GAF domain-containing protein [Halobacillus dabanensis]SFJ46795.1 rsbT co-antagonist protein RsbR [Halobacillus dabanensis]